MRILIDTHILIWHLEGDEQLSPDSRSLITDPANSVFISIASFWEIAIKSSRGKLSLAHPSMTFLRRSDDQAVRSFLSSRNTPDKSRNFLFTIKIHSTE